jgi:hypothetical protein
MIPFYSILDHWIMNWEALSALAEVIGAVAVVISIIYLARQITESNTTAQASTTLDVSKVFSDWHRGVNTTPDLADIWYRGMANDQSLDQKEKARFNFLNAEFFILAEGLYRQFRLGFVKDEAWQPMERIIPKFFSSVLFAAWWESGASANGEDFRSYVNGLRDGNADDNWGEDMMSVIKTEVQDSQRSN